MRDTIESDTICIGGAEIPDSSGSTMYTHCIECDDGMNEDNDIDDTGGDWVC